MTEITAELLEKHGDQILKLTGEDSFLDWTEFQASSRKVMEAVNALNKEVAVFREAQQVYFIQNMKKMKGTDLPDMFKSVKSNKLNPKALKSVVNRFKMDGQEIALAEPIESLKQEALANLESYVGNNKEIVQQVETLANFLKERVDKYGFKQEVVAKTQQAEKYEFKHKFEETEIQTICNEVPLQFIPGTDSLISLNTYKHIAELSPNLCGEAYAALTRDARKSQRENVKNPKQYLESMNEFMSKSETLISEAQLVIVCKLGIPISKFEESEMLLMERGLAHNIIAIQTMARSKLREKVKATKSVSLEQSLDILNYQIELIEKKAGYIKEILSGILNQQTPEAAQLVPMILTFILNDLVYEKYQVEEEDFMQNIQEKVIATNPEVQKIFYKMEEAIMNLMKKLNIVPEDFGRNEQGMGMLPGMAVPSPQQSGPNNQARSPAMPPMGLMPGVDPLQYQQMQAQLNMLNKKK